MIEENYIYEGLFNKIRNSRWESSHKFFNSFSQYNITTGKFTAKYGGRISNNCGGVPLGINTLTGNICVDSSDAHSLIIGSTGSKKSRLVVMPTIKILSDASESMIISDPKAEIFNQLSHYLKQKHYKLYIINLRNPAEGDSWNPLALPYLFYKNGNLDKTCEFVNDIAINLMLSERDHGDPFWDYSARDLFFGLTLLLFKYCKTQRCSEENITISNLLKLRRTMFTEEGSVTNSSLWELAKKDEIIASSLIGTVMAPFKTQSSILSTFDEKMRIFVIQPNLVGMLSTNSISLDEIGLWKSAIFLIMPDEKTSYHRLISVFIKQSYEYIIFKAQSMKNSRMKVRINYVLDEFSSLPAIKDFSAMITASRSRNIRFHLIIQSKNQLIARYKEDADTIFSNCMNWIFLTSREIPLLKDISLLCGEQRYKSEPLMPIAALQHLNKEKGEILVLSGRLYPYISRLLDIDKYLISKTYCTFEMKKRINKPASILEFDFIEDYLSQKNKSADCTQANEENTYDEDNVSEIEKKLEAKFDELFGISEENH